MANVYAEYLSSLGKEAEIMFLENEAEDQKLYALLSLRDAALEASYLEAEAVVLRENGSADDLLFYYKEAEEEAAKDKPGIVQKLINLIRNQITKFLEWLRKVTGKNNERLNTLKGTEQTVSKAHFKIIGTLLNAWDTIHNKINDWYNQLSTRKQEILSLGSITFMTFGLKELGKDALEKLKNDKSTETVPGDEVVKRTEESEKVEGTLHKLMGKFEDLLKTLKTTGENSYKDAQQAAINRKQQRANAAAANAGEGESKGDGEVTQDSVNYSSNSLFGDLMLETENKNKDGDVKSEGKGLPVVHDTTKGGTAGDGKSEKSGENKDQQSGNGNNPQPAPAGNSGTDNSGSGNGEKKSLAQRAIDRGEKAKSQQVAPVAPENGAEQVTKDDLPYGAKAVVVIETILRFIKSMIDILNGSMVELMQQIFSAIFAKFKGKGENGEEGTVDNGSGDGNGNQNGNDAAGTSDTSAEGKDEEGGEGTHESASDNLFGMALDDDVPVTESVMDELAEILNYI